MAIYQGTFYTAVFIIQDEGGNAVNITGWEFKAMFRKHLDDEVPLITLTTADGGFEVTDGAAGTFRMSILEDETELLTLGSVVFDVLRTDNSPGPVWIFGGKVKVKEPVTRS